MEPSDQEKKWSDVYSLSSSQLADILDEWSCSSHKCIGSHKSHFRINLDCADRKAPFVLNCGHYICSECLKDLLDNEKSYTCGHNYQPSNGLKRSVPSDCKGKMELEELKKAPLAHHITKLMPCFMYTGVTCDYCSYRANLSKSLASKEKVIRYPSVFMRVFIDSFSKVNPSYDL
ncbi:hypothetical protein PFISCL1PPCAC_14573 [Pristionchus fissidentatus]|uniref:RING-type domain-containing protein n=1 Tax=Pristionchus fissidentatus TaxID=1538716 RepID=A0AAV5VUV4_9BILA|nr:hypothetical protein PFISCL1PPCAC_14573 [Pristionchus fissidentatus]